MIRLLLLLFLVTPALVLAHGGEDHSAGGAQTSVGASAVTTSVLSRRFEVVLKHAPVIGGQPYRGTLYLADFATNAPVTGATIALEEPGVSGRPFTVRASGEPGVYVVERTAGFARNGEFNVAVRIGATGGSDLVLLQNVYIGPVEAPAPAAGATAQAEEGAPASEGAPWLWILVVLALGAGFAAWLVFMARKRRQEAGAAAAPDSSGLPLAPEHGSARSYPTP